MLVTPRICHSETWMAWNSPCIPWTHRHPPASPRWAGRRRMLPWAHWTVSCRNRTVLWEEGRVVSLLSLQPLLPSMSTTAPFEPLIISRNNPHPAFPLRVSTAFPLPRIKAKFIHKTLLLLPPRQSMFPWWEHLLSPHPFSLASDTRCIPQKAFPSTSYLDDSESF